MTAGETCGGENVWYCASDRASERECGVRERESEREREREREIERESKGTRSENEYKYVLSVLRTSVKKKKSMEKRKTRKSEKNHIHADEKTGNNTSQIYL